MSSTRNLSPPAFPHETSHSYSVTPRFANAPDSEDAPLTVSIDLPMAAPPTQTPKVTAAGIALSTYRRADDYSSTEPRDRMLWIELEAAPENPRDDLFTRVLSYAPDPMLTRDRAEYAPPVPPVPPEPPLPIDPEWVRVIHPGQSDDRAGLDAMQPLIPTASPTHFLVPLPPDLTSDSRELFGFFVYELRVGHAIGSTTRPGTLRPRAAGRWGAAPAAAAHLHGDAHRGSGPGGGALCDTGFRGRTMLPQSPATQIWFLLYAQVLQADGKDYRNILLGRRRGILGRKTPTRVETDLSGSGQWSEAEIAAALDAYGLPRNSPLSVLAVELLPEVEPPNDPLGASLGEVRLLRTSPLVKLSGVCLQPPCPVA